MFCSNCGKEISEGSKFCNYCGVEQKTVEIKKSKEQKKIEIDQEKKDEVQKPEKKKTSPIVILFLILFIVGAYYYYKYKMGDSEISTSPSKSQYVPPPRPVITEPLLELQNWSWNKEYSHAIVSGQVKNISNQSLKNVCAVVSFYDKSKNFITSSDSLIEYNPIMPGQTSPFKLYETWNPLMNSAKVEFKYLFGEQIEFKIIIK